MRSTCHFVNVIRTATRADLKKVGFRKLLYQGLCSRRLAESIKNGYRPSSLLIRFALAGDVPIFLSNKRRTRDVLFRRRWLFGPLLLRTFPVLVT